MDFFAEFMKFVVWCSVGLGTLIGWGIHALILSIARNSTSLPAQTKVTKKGNG